MQVDILLYFIFDVFFVVVVVVVVFSAFIGLTLLLNPFICSPVDNPEPSGCLSQR